MLEVGVEEGDQAYQLFRVFSALRLADGTVVIGNAGSGELRFFDRSGRFLRSAGRHGAGPGEFGEYSAMHLWRSPGGALVVDDRGNNRVNLFDSTGAFLSAVHLEPLPDAPRAWPTGVFGDGSWLAAAPEGGGIIQGVPGTVIEGARFRYTRYASDGRPLNSMLSLEGRPRYVHRVVGIIHYPYIPLTAEPLLAAHGERLYVLRGSAPELEQWGLDGALAGLVRWRPPHQRRSADIYERYKREALEDIPDANQRRRYERYFQQYLPIPESVPTYRTMLVDTDDHVWLERYRLPWERQRRWDVIDPAGRWLGTIDTPEALWVYEIGTDFVLGLHLDSLRVERIRLHELIKPSR